MSTLHILVVDDEPAIRQVLAAQVQKAGYEARHVGDGTSAVQELAAGDIDICICDIRLPDFDGIEVLRRTREAGVDTSFLMMTAFASINTAIEAMKLGAYDYLMKPLRNEDVLRRIEQIADLKGLQEENQMLRKLVDSQVVEVFESRSPSMLEIERMAAKVAKTSGTVLITGESGTGKTFIAKKIHEQSPRNEGRFVSVNCGAIPENLLESEFFGHLKGAFTGADKAKKGLFREADGGTLFLDEVAELPLALQVKLLHALEEKEVRPLGSEQIRKVNVRIIAATNREIEKMVANGEFREDLYYRLNVMHIQMPTLKSRKEDLPGLIRFFMQREAERLELNQSYDIDSAAEDILVGLEWQGNLREMQNIIARALILADTNIITVADLPPQINPVRKANGLTPECPSLPQLSGDETLREQVKQYEIQAIKDAVNRAGGDRQKAAKNLGIGISTLYRKLEESDG